MRFDPRTLLYLARRSGFELRRRGSTLILLTGGKDVPAVWIEALKRHKIALLEHLEEERSEDTGRA